MAETFEDFMRRNPQYMPVKHEEISNVYRKQHEAFIVYVNECVQAKMAEIDDLLRYRHINP